MADVASSKIINEIQAIISDHLQVVSYKWLSRNFSVPSNAAKRLLLEFVEQHGDELEVIYAISGWLKSEPQHYSVQLVQQAKLEEVKAQFVDACSTHVYSVQPCLPKDPAELWNAEFVQAEELFNQATSIENCLRDNRFSGVSCSLVSTLATNNLSKHHVLPQQHVSLPLQKSVETVPKTAAQVPIVETDSKTGSDMKNSSAPPVPETDLASTLAINNSSKHHVLPQKHVSSPLQKSVETGPKTAAQVPIVETDLKTGSDMKNSSAGKSMHGSDTGKVSTAAADKKKGQNGKGTGGALASLWGRASSKPKPNSPPPPANNVKDVVPPAMNAEAQVCALEAAGHISSDDDAEGFSCIRRRPSNNGSGQNRRVVFNMSDDENEDEIFDSETVVSLASPELPEQRPGFMSDIEAKIVTGTAQESKDICEEQRVEKTRAAFPNKSMTSSSKSINGNQAGQTHGKGKGKINGAAGKKNDKATNLKENLVCPAKVVNNKHEVHTDHVALDDTLVSKPAIKKRKVVKTRIDDRGREVTEIAWEADVVELEKVEDDTHPVKKSSVPGHGDNKPQTTTKGQSTEHNHPANRMSKTNSKHTAKGAGKDTRQGNILSFFKKA